jgi:hypothetical protein
VPRACWRPGPLPSNPCQARNGTQQQEPLPTLHLPDVATLGNRPSSQLPSSARPYLHGCAREAVNDRVEVCCAHASRCGLQQLLKKQVPHCGITNHLCSSSSSGYSGGGSSRRCSAHALRGVGVG